jgi:hypothetical protein
MSAVSFPSSSLRPRRLPSALGGLSRGLARFPTSDPRTPVDTCRTAVEDRFVGFLRDRHPCKTAENVAADTGCSVAAVSKWIERRSLPMLPSFLRLVNAYGPEFLAALMNAPDGWLVEARRSARQQELEAQRARIDRELDAF